MDYVVGVCCFGLVVLFIVYVSCGWFDGFFEDGLSVYDYGVLFFFVWEVGGWVMNFVGEDVGIDKSSILVVVLKYYCWLLQGFKGQIMI